MWNPLVALTPEEQKIAACTRKTGKFFVFLRERRHALLDADLQPTLTQSYSPEPGGKAPVEAGLLALATLLQAYCHGGDRDAVEITVLDKRWQMVLDCLGTEQPPFSQSTLCNFRMRLIPAPDGGPGAGASRSTSRLTGASPSRTRLCVTAAKAAPKPSRPLVREPPLPATARAARGSQHRQGQPRATAWAHPAAGMCGRREASHRASPAP
jgi:hypothetical protein